MSKIWWHTVLWHIIKMINPRGWIVSCCKCYVSISKLNLYPLGGILYSRNCICRYLKFESCFSAFNDNHDTNNPYQHFKEKNISLPLKSWSPPLKIIKILFENFSKMGQNFSQDPLKLVEFSCPPCQNLLNSP